MGKLIKWELRRSVNVKDAKLLKTPEHQQYARRNDGAWVVCSVPDAGGEFYPVAEVCFRGKAKRGQAWNAEDPEGMENARKIAEAPAMYELLTRLNTAIGNGRRDVAADLIAHEVEPILQRINAKGE